MVGLLSAWRSWSERRQILRDIRTRRADHREQIRFKVKDELTHALSALERDDHKYASDVWSKLMEREPEVARESRLALRVLLGLRRFDEAEAIMLVGQKKHTTDPYYAKGLAEVAQAKGDLNIAVERWAFLRKRFPGVVEGYSHGASALRELGQIQSAESLALVAIERFPDQVAGPLEYARIAVERQAWEEALQRWEIVRDRFGYKGGFLGCAQALAQLGRYADAEEILERARLQFSSDPEFLCELARVAEKKDNSAQSAQRWKEVVRRFPLDMHVTLAASEAFERLGDAAEAEATLRACIERFELEERPRLELAKLFHYQRRDFTAAANAWAELRKAFPDNTDSYLRGAEALRESGQSEEADALREEYSLRFKLS